MDNFFATVAQTGQYKDLFLSNVGFVNKDTAPIYGLDATKYNTSLTQVQLDANQRPGFMTRLGFLSSYSHYSDTSPILRGAFIVIYMLGVNVPPAASGRRDDPATAGQLHDEPRTRSPPWCKDERHLLRRVPHQRHQSLRLRAGELQRDWSVADGRTSWAERLTRKATVDFGDGTVEDVTTAPQLMQGIAASPAGQATYAQYWTGVCLRPRSEPARSVRRGLDCRQHRRGVVPLLNILSDLTQADAFSMRVRATP